MRREAILKRRGEVNGKPGPAKVTDKLSATRSYASRAAAELGVDERTVRRDLRRAKSIDPAVLESTTPPGLNLGGAECIVSVGVTTRTENRPPNGWRRKVAEAEHRKFAGLPRRARLAARIDLAIRPGAVRHVQRGDP